MEGIGKGMGSCGPWLSWILIEPDCSRFDGGLSTSPEFQRLDLQKTVQGAVSRVEESIVPEERIVLPG